MPSENEEQLKASEVLPPNNNGSQPDAFSLWEYLNGDRGHEIAKTILTLWKDLQQATLGSKSEQTIEQLRSQSRSWRIGIVMQSALAAVVIVSAVVLAWRGRMDATIAGFLGVALGYILGKKTG